MWSTGARLQQGQEALGQVADDGVVDVPGRPSLSRAPATQDASYAGHEPVERRDRQRDRAVLVVVDQGEQRLGQPGEVPARRRRGWLPYAYRPPWSIELKTVAGS